MTNIATFKTSNKNARLGLGTERWGMDERTKWFIQFITPVGGELGQRQRERLINWLIKLNFLTVKILAQRPTHISAVATVLLITNTFTVKYYDRRIKTNTASRIIIIIHIKRDSDCNGNEKDNSERKKLEGKNKTFWVIYRESWEREGIKLSLRKRQ